MISVVIPLYNKWKSIGSTLQSVLNQTFQDFEVVVVDDGSTDNGGEVVKTFDDPRIRLISKKNSGVSSARNAGICEARSEHIAFLDADDLWEPDFLKEINRQITDFPNAGIYGTSYYYLSNGDKKNARKPLPHDFYGVIDNADWEFAHIYCSTAVCCKKEALKQCGMFDERIAYGEDIDVWWRIMLNYPAVYSNKALAVYRFDEENRAMNSQIPLDKLYIYYFEKYEDYRRRDEKFRHFIDKECMWWLQKYIGKVAKCEIDRILGYIDLSEYKWTFRLRFAFPMLYNLMKTDR